MRAPGSSAAGPHLDRFVGRTSELADLENDLATLPHPRGPVRILRGVAGVGKTRLAEELSRRAAATGMAVAWGRSPEGLSAPPYWPWIQVVRALLDHKSGTDLAGLVLSDPAPVQRFELFDATAAVVRSAAERCPLLVVLDDLHTADLATLQMTRFVARHVSDAPVLIVATVRTHGELDAETVEHLDALGRLGHARDLTGFDVAAVADLLGAEHAEAIHAVTGGNALHVHEAARSLEAILDSAVPASPDELDAALRTTVIQRIRALDATHRRVLDAAAVLGFEIDRRELASLVEPLDPVTLDRLIRRLDADGFVIDADPVRFRHPLPARMLLETMPPPEREALHRRAADTIGDDPARVSEVAHHLLQAGPAHRHDAVVASRLAASGAAASAAHEVSVALLSRALDVVDAETDGRLRLDVLLDLGAALWRSGRSADADRTYEQAWEQAVALGDADGLARAVVRNGVEYYFADAPRRKIVPRVERALAAQAGEEGPVHARLLAELATHHLARDVERGRELADRAVEIARRFDDPVALGNALIARQVTDLGPATLVRRIGEAHEILTCAADADDYRLVVHGRFLLMGALLEAGDISGVDGELILYDGFAEDLGEPRYDRFSMWLRATRAMLDGDVAAAESLAQRSLAISESLGDPDAFAVYGGQLGVLLWMQGRVQEMEPVYRDLRAAEPHEALWPAVLAWIAATHGEAEAARGALAAVPDLSTLPSGMHWLLTTTTYAETAALVGTDRQVESAWNALVPYADRMVPIAMGAAAWGTVAKPLGHLALRRGRIDEGIDYLRTAVRTCARLGARPWMIEAQLDLADALDEHRPGDPEISILRAEARRAASRLGLGLFLRRLERVPADTAAPAPEPADVPASATPAVEGRPQVKVIGRFEVIGASGEAASWSSRKARELLKILVSRRGAPISRETLMDLLWPDQDPDTLSNRLSVALSTVRRALDPERRFSAGDLVSTAVDAVALDLDVVQVDVEDLLSGARAVLAGDGDPTAAATAAELLDRYRGEALPDEPHSEWATALRGEVRAAMLSLARLVATDAEARDDHQLAAEAHRRSLDIDPYDEVANRGLIAAFRALGAHGQAETATATYRQRLAELGIEVD